MDKTELFEWVRSNQPTKSLTQPQVNAVDNMLVTMSIDDVMDNISKLNGWELPSVDNTTSKKLSKQDIINAANNLGIEPAALKSVIDVEARSSGFDSQGRPTILFERHKFWDELGKVNYFTWRQKFYEQYPDICNPKSGGYNERDQYEKLRIASELHWEAAHKSASYGLGQIMGFNFESLGYKSLKEFVEDMYESEAKQLEAMARFLKVNNLIPKLKSHDWSGFARGYNGSAYKKNNYDVKLANAYAKAKKEGW